MNYEDFACKSRTCDKRHPKECKYYTNYRRCKFSPCKFSHIEKMNYVIESSQTKEKFEDFAKSIEKKFDTFESNLLIMKKVLSEKDDYIHTLEAKIDAFENISEAQNVKIEQLVTQIKNISDVSIIPTQKFKCRNCDFETSSEKGLKQHNSKKHIKSENKGVTFRCEKCFFLGNSKESLDIHNGKDQADSFEYGLCESIF